MLAISSHFDDFKSLSFPLHKESQGRRQIHSSQFTPLQESATNSEQKLQTPLNPTNTTIDSHPNHFLTKLVCNPLSFGLKGLISATTPSLLVEKRRVLRDRATPTVFKCEFKCEFGRSDLPAGKFLTGVQAVRVVTVFKKNKNRYYSNGLDTSQKFTRGETRPTKFTFRWCFAISKHLSFLDEKRWSRR